MDDQLWQRGWNGSAWVGYGGIGGVLEGATSGADAAPVAVGRKGTGNALDLFYPRTDHGQLGVWWKYWPYQQPCYHASEECGECAD